MKTAIICGCGHSGTTLLATMFAAHPSCFVPLKETRVFFRRRWWLRLLALKAMGLLKGRPVLVEKTPRHVEILDKIQEKAPDTKMILMVRDGRDVSASLFKRFNDQAGAVERWVSANEAIAAVEESPNAIVVRYEDLVVDAETELRKLCEFVGIEYTDAMLNYHQQQRNWFGTKGLEKGADADGKDHDNLRNWQVNQPIFDGRGKWKKVFDEAPAELFEGKALGLMERYGYLAEG